jgi:hypothetical protein
MKVTVLDLSSGTASLREDILARTRRKEETIVVKIPSSPLKN